MQADSSAPKDPSLPSRCAEYFLIPGASVGPRYGIGLAGVRRGGEGRNLSGTAGIAFTRLKKNVLLGALFYFRTNRRER